MSIITLIDKYLEDLMEERNNFIDDLNQFPNFEKQVRRLSNELASGILSLTLSEADELIRNSGLRKDGYMIRYILSCTSMQFITPCGTTESSINLPLM